MANKVNINNASLEQLSKIEGITRETAEAIISYRENKKGNIESMDELGGINGIDFYLLENIRNVSTI